MRSQKVKQNFEMRNENKKKNLKLFCDFNLYFDVK